MSTLARERMQKILERWFLIDPLLFSVWSDHQVISAAVSTLRIGGGVIRYNPAFIDSLTPVQLEAVMRCEAVRILLKHPYSRCLQPAHIAWQASNITLAEHLGPLPIALPTAVEVFGHHRYDRQFYEFYHQHLLEESAAGGMENAPDSTASTIPGPLPGGTDAPPDEPVETAGEGGSPPASPSAEMPPSVPSGGNGRDHARPPLDSHLHSPCTGLENTQDWQEDELFSEKIDARISDAELSRNWGRLPDNLREKVLANRQPQLDYRSVLRLFHQSILSRQRRLTRMKCSRRYGFLYMGSRYDFTTRLLVAIDVSGSMRQADMALGLSLINRFFRYGIECIDVIAFDTRIQGEALSLKRARREITVTGRGGTDFNAVIDYVDAHPRYDGVLLVTDGCAPCPHPPKTRRIPLLWVFIDQKTWQTSAPALKTVGRSVFIRKSR